MQPGELRFGSRVWTPEHDFGEALRLTCSAAEKRELERLEDLARAGRLLRRVLPAGDQFYMVCKSSSEVRGILSEEDRIVDVVVSDATIDHYRDSIDANGWKFDWYQSNPVVLYDHWYSVHGIVGHSERWWVESGQLLSRDRFDDPEENEAAGMVFKKILSKSLRTVSVGFKPIAWKKILNAEGEWTGGFLFSEQQKLEHSWVAIPANPNAHLGLGAATPGKGLPESTLQIAKTLTTRLQAGSLVERLRGD
jgi:hypothetical protein